MNTEFKSVQMSFIYLALFRKRASFFSAQLALFFRAFGAEPVGQLRHMETKHILDLIFHIHIRMYLNPTQAAFA